MIGAKDNDCKALIIFTLVELLDFIFRLGVVFAIYGFLWGIFEVIYRILTSRRKRNIGEVYLIRGIKYAFLADVTFLFCINGGDTSFNFLNQMIIAGIVLLTYFVGKLQNNQNRTRLFRMMGPGMQLPQQINFFNQRAEIIVIAIALLIFTGLNFGPQFASNPISLWFYKSIVDIEKTFFFGFIFKVIGFFFLLNLLSKFVAGITFLLNGGKPPKGPFDENNNQSSSSDDFDDWEEIK